MRAISGTAGAGSKEAKPVQNASSKVVGVVDKVLLPLVDVFHQTHVNFSVVDDQAAFDLVEDVERRVPEVMVDADTFVGYFRCLYDRYVNYSKGYAPAPSGPLFD
jgi:hypothetical protein